MRITAIVTVELGWSRGRCLDYKARASDVCTLFRTIKNEPRVLRRDKVGWYRCCAPCLEAQREERDAAREESR